METVKDRWDSPVCNGVNVIPLTEKGLHLQELCFPPDHLRISNNEDEASPYKFNADQCGSTAKAGIQFPSTGGEKYHVP